MARVDGFYPLALAWRKFRIDLFTAAQFFFFWRSFDPTFGLLLASFFSIYALIS
jgi:hypothetical protein